MDEEGRVKKYLESLTWAHLEPHSTQKKGRSCESCHQNPKALGLGYGKIILKEGKITLEPLEKPVKQNLRLSQIVSMEGENLVQFNRPKMRGFNKEELTKILRVGLCLNCHSQNHTIFQKWKNTLKCPKFPNL